MQTNYTLKDVERFWGKVKKSDNPDDCWLWTGYRRESEYGEVRLGYYGKSKYAHRVAYELTFGELPIKMHVYQKCNNHACCNPAHLFSRNDEYHFWENVSKTSDPDECWPWLAGCFPNGYGCTKWNKISQGAHRVAWMLTYGGIPESLYVLHSCDNPPCCNPKHLFLGTHQDNMDDMYQKGRGNHPTGDENKNHKLSDLQVSEIRRRYGFRGIGGENARVLAREFGVSFGQISNIVNNKQRT